MSGSKDDKYGGQLDKPGMGIKDGLPLNVSSGGIEELRADIQRLMDIEAIKQLKHAYFRCIDTANFRELEELLHDDVTVDFIGGSYEWKLNGKHEYVASVRKAFTREAVGHHNGHHPEIQILSESEATGIWYLADDMWVLTHKFHTKGTAMYWDRYVKVDGSWKIRETRYRRIYEMSGLLEQNPEFSSHHLATHGTEV